MASELPQPRRVHHGPGNLHGPRCYPRGGVGQGGFVEQCVVGDPGETLHQMKVAGRRAESPLIMKIRGLDDERFPLPMAAGGTQPVLNVLRDGWSSVQGNDTHVATGLSDENDVARCLNNLGLADLLDKRNSGGACSDDATLVGVTGFDRIAPQLRLAPGLTLGRVRRHFPVRRIDD